MQGKVQNGICLVVTKTIFEIRWGRFMIKIKDNIIKLDFHEETLHCDIYADGTKWTWQQDYKPYFKYNEKNVFFSRGLKQFHIKDMIQE